MHFTCESCKASLNIADEKVKGKRLVVRCKRCNSRIQIADPALGMAAILLSGQEGPAGAGAARPAPRPAPAAGREPSGGQQSGPAWRAPGPARPGMAPAPRSSIARRDLDPEPFDDTDTESTRAMDSEVLERALRASKSADRQPASPSRPASPRQVSTPRAGPVAAQRPAPVAARGPALAEDLDPVTSASGAGGSQAVPWFAMIAGKQEGPLSRESLRAYAASGVLGPRTYVWTEGMEGWARAREVPDLAAFFAKIAPPTAAQPPPRSAAPPPPERPGDARHPAPQEEAQPALDLDDYDPTAEQEGLERAGLERAGLERAGLERAGLERAGPERAGLEHERPEHHPGKALEALDPVAQPEPRAREPLSPGYNPFGGAAPGEIAGPAAPPGPAQARASGADEEESLELDEPSGRGGLREAWAKAQDRAPAPEEGQVAGAPSPSVDELPSATEGPSLAVDEPSSAGAAGLAQEAAPDPAGEAHALREGAQEAEAERPAGGAPDADRLAGDAAPQVPEELENPAAAAPEEELAQQPGQRAQAGSGFGFGLDQAAGSRARPLLFAASAVIAAAALLLVFASRPRPQRPADPAPAQDGRTAASADGQPGSGAAAGVSVVEAPVVHATPGAAPAQGESPGRGAGESPLTAEDVRRKLDQNKPSLQRCIDEALRRGPRDPALHAGRIRITARISPSGAVSGAKIDKDVVGESKLGACLRDVTRRIVFPAFSGAPVDVDIPIDVRAGN